MTSAKINQNIHKWPPLLPTIIYFLFISIFISGTPHHREDNQHLYSWAEVMGQHTQTFNGDSHLTYNR